MMMKWRDADADADARSCGPVGGCGGHDHGIGRTTILNTCNHAQFKPCPVGLWCNEGTSASSPHLVSQGPISCRAIDQARSSMQLVSSPSRRKSSVRVLLLRSHRWTSALLRCRLPQACAPALRPTEVSLTTLGAFWHALSSLTGERLLRPIYHIPRLKQSADRPASL
jgi:hypothetical protein